MFAVGPRSLDRAGHAAPQTLLVSECNPPLNMETATQRIPLHLLHNSVLGLGEMPLYCEEIEVRSG